MGLPRNAAAELSVSDRIASDPQFQEALRLFNAEEFFACHDVLEELWTDIIGPERQFLQGLIHAAVALFHFGEGNLGGARKMHDSAVEYLRAFLPAYAGIDLAKFLNEFDDCFAALLGPRSSYPTGVSLDADLIPRIPRCSPGNGTD